MTSYAKTSLTETNVSIKWSKLMTGEQLKNSWKTDVRAMVSNTIWMAAEKFRMDAVNVRTALEKFRTDKASCLNNTGKITNAWYRVGNCDLLIANATKSWALATTFSALVPSWQLVFCPGVCLITKENHDTTFVFTVTLFIRKSIGY